MQTLLQDYEVIYKKIKAYRERIEDYEQQIITVSSHRNDEIPKRIENLKEQLSKIDEYQERLDGFIQLAEKHMVSKNLSTIEAPPGYRVNLNRLRAWSMLIDPMAEDDTYAKRVYLVAKCDEVFLEGKRQEFTEKIESLQRDYDIGAPEELKNLEGQIEAEERRLGDYLSQDEMLSFAERVRKENDSNIYSSSPTKYEPETKLQENWIFGACGKELPVSEKHKGVLKNMLGKYYDAKDSMVYLPIECVPTDEEFAMNISCVPARKRLIVMDKGIRSLIMHAIDRSNAGSRRIYVLDAERWSSSVIGSLRSLEGGAVVKDIPRNPEQLQDTLQEIVSSLNDLEDSLERHDTVIEYNEDAEEGKKLPRTIVIIVGWPNAESLKRENGDYIRRILSNYERYGISFITVNISSEEKKDRKKSGISEYTEENLISIDMTNKKSEISIGQDAPMPFMWYPFDSELSDEYISEVEEKNASSDIVQTEYINHIDLSEGSKYHRGKKTINLPYGVDSRGQLHSISFDNENFAGYLMGASGSGKSTLLHTLITGIIRDYHPDDVELWLADFKMSEFAQYIDPMPPHVKYILLDESPELVFDLIDKLTEKMMERQRFFMKNRSMKKVENVPSDIYMPVIFLILDEFSIMSQAINNAPTDEYKLKLQNLLAKGRALGIKFIFSSQTFIRGIAGLTPTAKAQIQMRIAMKAPKDEITETLELSAAQKTDQVQAWIDALPPHVALVKYRDGEEVRTRKDQVLYFKGTAENAYEVQKKLIESTNSRMKYLEEYMPGEIDSYVYKNPVVVDGNSFDAYDETLIRETEEFIRAESRGGFLDSDHLLALGRPRLMDRIRFMSLTQESRENILLISNTNERMCGASIILSIAKQYRSHGGQIVLWTYARDRMYRDYAEIMSGVMDVKDDMDSICDDIREMKKRIDSRETGDVLVVMLGMDRIVGDFGFAAMGSPYSAGMASSIDKKTADAMKSGVKSIDDLDPQEKRLHDATCAWGKKKREIKKNNKDKSEEEIRVLLEKARERIFKKYGLINDSSEAPRATVERDDQDKKTIEEDMKENNQEQEEIGAYNAFDDLIFVINQGSRFGYHFLLNASGLTDIKTSGMNVDMFRHRIGFAMSKDESRDIMGHSGLASDLPSHIAQYTNQIDSFSVRPYIHQGVDWDGWWISEDGDLMDPLKS